MTPSDGDVESGTSSGSVQKEDSDPGKLSSKRMPSVYLLSFSGIFQNQQTQLHHLSTG